MGEWTFFSNHGHVLVCLTRDREARLRDVAMQVGITERAVQKIVKDMQEAGFLEISKHGRRNRYRINNRKSLRHPLHSGCTVGQLIQLLNKHEAMRPAASDQSVPEKAPSISRESEVKKPGVRKSAPPPQVDPSRLAEPAELLEPSESAELPETAEPLKQTQEQTPSEPAEQVEPPEQAESPQQEEAAKPEYAKSEKDRKKPDKADLEQGQLF